MFVISNNCCGGYLYNHIGVKYNNPFIWHRMTYDSVYFIMRNFNKIDWLDYGFEKSTSVKNTFNIKVGNNISIHYAHYVFDKNASVITKNTTFDKTKYDFWQGDVKYCKIWELINEKYLTRTKRMLELKEEPAFIIRDDEKYVKEPSKTYTINDIINAAVPYKRIIITENNKLKADNELCKIILVKDVYNVHPEIQIRTHLQEIKDFLGL